MIRAVRATTVKQDLAGQAGCGWSARMQNRPSITVQEFPDAGTFEAIFRRLDKSSRDIIGPARPQLLAIPIYDDAGGVAGGLWGCTLFQWLHMQLLFITEAVRNRDAGSTLVRLAEAEARSRGCIGACVTAMSFQAAPFYMKLGYTVFGTLADCPPGHATFYLRKRFDAVARDATIPAQGKAPVR